MKEFYQYYKDKIVAFLIVLVILLIISNVLLNNACSSTKKPGKSLTCNYRLEEDKRYVLESTVKNDLTKERFTDDERNKHFIDLMNLVSERFKKPLSFFNEADREDYWRCLVLYYMNVNSSQPEEYKNSDAILYKVSIVLTDNEEITLHPNGNDAPLIQMKPDTVNYIKEDLFKDLKIQIPTGKITVDQYIQFLRVQNIIEMYKEQDLFKHINCQGYIENDVNFYK